MKILHTADWHLGKKLGFYHRIEEQINVLEEIVQIADKETVDMIIIAGDLFDSFNPSAEAIELFYKTLKKLSLEGKRPVIAIAGNHDAPKLIDAPDPLARECGILLIGYPKSTIPPTQLQHFSIANTDQGFVEIHLPNLPYPVRILHTAYANELRLKEYLGENKEDQLNEVLANHWQQLAEKYCDNKGVNLLTAHLYMNKRGEILEEPEGEKPIKIGNADMIYTDAIPPQIQYAALGHIHRYYNIGSKDQPAVYASSPLCYSFSEAGQEKKVIIIDAKPNQPVSIHPITLEQGRKLYRKKFYNIDQAIQWLQEHPNTLVEITIVSDTYITAQDKKKLDNAHDGIIHIIPVLTKQEKKDQENKKNINLSEDIQQLFQNYFQYKHGQFPNEEILALFEEIRHYSAEKK